MDRTKKIQLALAIVGVVALLSLMVFLAFPGRKTVQNTQNTPNTQEIATQRYVIDSENAGIPKIVFAEGNDSTWKNSSTVVRISVDKESENIPVYSASGVFIPLGKITARDLAPKFGFTGTPLERGDGTGVVWKWQDDTRNLLINLDQKTLQYSADYYTDTSLIAEGKEVLAEDALVTARNYLDQLGLNTTYIDLENAKVKKLPTAGGHIGQGNAVLTIARVSFPYSLSGIPTYVPGDFAESLEIDVTNTDKVVGMRAFYHDGEIFKYRDVKTYPFQNGMNLVPTDILVVSNTLRDNPNPVGMLKSIRIDELSLAYDARNKDLGYIVPFYVGKGNGQTLDGEATDVIVHIPAY